MIFVCLYLHIYIFTYSMLRKLEKPNSGSLAYGIDGESTVNSLRTNVTELNSIRGSLEGATVIGYCKRLITTDLKLSPLTDGSLFCTSKEVDRSRNGKQTRILYFVGLS